MANIKLTRFSPNRSIRVHHLKNSSPMFEFHAHDSYELIMLTNCNGMRYIGDSVSRTEENELILIPPYVRHTWDCESKAQDIVVVLFGNELLDTAIPEFQPVIHWLKAINQVVTLTLDTKCKESLYKTPMLEMKQSNSVEQVTKVVSILDSLRTSCDKNEPHITAIQQAWLPRLIEYISADEIRSFTDCASKFNMSESSLKRLLKKELDTNFTELYRHIRIKKAQRLLARTSIPISIIAEQSNFNSVRSFNEAFKAYSSVTPKQFRIEHQWRLNG